VLNDGGGHSPSLVTKHRSQRMSHSGFSSGAKEVLYASFEDDQDSDCGRSSCASLTDNGDDAADSDTDVHVHQERRKGFLDSKIIEDRWEIENPESVSLLDSETRIVKKPNASHINHKCLTPWIHQKVDDLDGLPGLAGIVGVPNNWAEHCNIVLSDARVLRRLRDLTSLDETREESDVQQAFISLVVSIDTVLSSLAPRKDLLPRSGVTVIVGGILADYSLDIRSKAVSAFRVRKGPYLIASEIKTIKSFPISDAVWHGKNRGAQAHAALFGFNCNLFTNPTTVETVC
jgi:hypothetical protein